MMDVVIACNWCKAGRHPMPLLLVQVNGSPQVVSKPPWDSADNAHGCWNIIEQTDDQLKMILAWHYTSTNDPNIAVKTMQEISGTLWQEKYNKTEHLEIFHVNATSPLYKILLAKSLPQATPIPGLITSETHQLHSIIRWLHPEKKQSFLALYRDGASVCFYKGDPYKGDDTWTNPHGRWNFEDQHLAVHFHHDGSCDEAGNPASPLTLLGPIQIPRELEHLPKLDTPCKILRAIGGSTRPNGTGSLCLAVPTAMQSWHILAQWMFFTDCDTPMLNETA